jgi:hypothetical protein
LEQTIESLVASHTVTTKFLGCLSHRRACAELVLILSYRFQPKISLDQFFSKQTAWWNKYERWLHGLRFNDVREVQIVLGI